MSLVKTSLLNGISVAIKIASGIVLNKILAVYVGPTGYAIIGQFQNAVSILASLAGGLLAQGVTKITAQHFDDEAKQHKVWQTAMLFSLVAALFAGFALLLTRDWISEWLLHRPDMSSLFVWIALFLPAMAANNLLLAIVNGKKEVGIYVIANITGSLFSLFVTGLLTYSFGLYGALLAFTINPAIVLMSTAVMVTRCHWFKVRFLMGKIDQPAVRELSGFAIMGITSAMVVPISYMLIRDYLASHLSLTEAGYWQATWNISGIFVMMATSTLSVYYLPRLAAIRTATELKAEIFKVYRFVMPVVTIGALTIYLLRDFIIRTLFTEDFNPMRELFAWQLLGDVLKIGSWILGYILVGRAMVKAFVISEIIFSTFFLGFSWLLINQFGLVGVTMAYAINYLLHWGAMAYLAIFEIKKMKQHA
ncbi:O-antigen translocase [Rhodoferax antarcticus]|uniref:Lipopolysaccharide biosynthesis protein n=1 Tax=Rhodoferax antarcticus ANT.BR TaxID=1111071 RepID=A0A1Q8YJ52_9BURK|nr:O-antigen translocase [Rhodoferax antarcticus]APW47781.1 O-antigen translocase [Rhodoferax antarcticus]OLP07993.1 lipopolysaccharide biosynthesis protein [Rhodoferax antarcticus ANT.BR]